MNNPYLNAVAASVYIALISTALMYIPRFFAQLEDTPFAPVIMLSLLVFSVATMGFLFFYRPTCLLLDGKRRGAVGFFLRTLGTFALITAIVVGAVVLCTPQSDYKNTSYIIDGEKVLLRDGVAESAVAPGSASVTTTRYFGNELRTDLDGDGREDVAFLITQEAGGTGTFFYVVAARDTGHGYVGSDAYFLGDRIAPQSIDNSQNQRQKHVIVVNYADRAPGQAMTDQPSRGKSVYLKLDPERMQWGIVEPNFEGEAR